MTEETKHPGKQLEAMIDKEDVCRRFHEGWEEWERFCDLMDKYPKASYSELKILLKDKPLHI